MVQNGWLLKIRKCVVLYGVTYPNTKLFLIWCIRERIESDIKLFLIWRIHNNIEPKIEYDPHNLSLIHLI